MSKKDLQAAAQAVLADIAALAAENKLLWRENARLRDMMMGAAWQRDIPRAWANGICGYSPNVLVTDEIELLNIAAQRKNDATVKITTKELEQRVMQQVETPKPPHGTTAAPKSKRGKEWQAFSNIVLQHIETYTVPQYGDAPHDQVESWTADQCTKQIGKYAARFGSNSRPAQDGLDLLKVAHYAALAYGKYQHTQFKSLQAEVQAAMAEPTQDTLTFSEALNKLKDGLLVARNGWNGKGMYLLLVKGEAITEQINDCYGDPNRYAASNMGHEAGKTLPVCDAVYMKTADNKLVPWLASQTDLLANDWIVL